MILKKVEELLISNNQEIIKPTFNLGAKNLGVKYLVYTESINKWWVNWNYSALKYLITLADLEIILDNEQNENSTD